MRLTGLLGTIICWFFLLAACGMIADAADPDTAYCSPDASLIQSRLITRASGDLYRADPAIERSGHPILTRADGTDDTPTIAFSLIGGSIPVARLARLGTPWYATPQEPHVITAPLFAFRRDRAHRIRDGGELSAVRESPKMGETALRVPGGFPCVRRVA